MKKSFLQNWLVLLCFVTTCLLVSEVTAQTQWNSTSSGLWTGNRVSLDGGGQIPADQRMSILTSNDRFGLYIKNTTTDGSTLPPPPDGICWPNGDEDFVGLYATSPGGWSALLDGSVGICGKIQMWAQNSLSIWNIDPDDVSGQFSISEVGSSAFFKLNRNANSENAFMSVSTENGSDLGLAVYENNAAQNPYFKVYGSGETVSRHSVAVYNGLANRPIKMISSVTGNENFYVGSDGHIFSRARLSIKTNKALRKNK